MSTRSRVTVKINTAMYFLVFCSWAVDEMWNCLELWMLGIPELYGYSFTTILKPSILREMCKNYVREVSGEEKNSYMVWAIGYSCCIMAVSFTTVCILKHEQSWIWGIG